MSKDAYESHAKRLLGDEADDTLIYVGFEIRDPNVVYFNLIRKVPLNGR